MRRAPPPRHQGQEVEQWLGEDHSYKRLPIEDAPQRVKRGLQQAGAGFCTRENRSSCGHRRSNALKNTSTAVCGGPLVSVERGPLGACWVTGRGGVDKAIC